MIYIYRFVFLLCANLIYHDVLCISGENEMRQMKIVGLALLFGLVLTAISAPCVAVPDEVVIGPYVVTFDLGVPGSSYVIEVDDPVTEESLGGSMSTEYSFDLTDKFDSEKTVFFSITEFDYSSSPKVLDQDALRFILESSLQKVDLTSVTTASRVVDGCEGAAGSGVMGGYDTIPLDMYAVLYVIDYDPVTSVFIGSSYPWSNTSKLFNTVHVAES